MSSQNETLAGNSKQLVEFDILKVDHQDEIRRHQNVVRHLNRSESTVEGLKARAKVLHSTNCYIVVLIYVALILLYKLVVLAVRWSDLLCMCSRCSVCFSSAEELLNRLGTEYVPGTTEHIETTRNIMPAGFCVPRLKYNGVNKNNTHNPPFVVYYKCYTYTVWKSNRCCTCVSETFSQLFTNG